MPESRRDALKLGVAGVIGAPLTALSSSARAELLGSSVTSLDCREPLRWEAGIEGQRKADLGNGTYLRA
jgi:hypothetical protein